MRVSADRLVLGILIAILAVGAAGCSRSTAMRASFTVEGMHCEACSSAITDALVKVVGVESASADHVSGSAEARFRSPAVTPEQLTAEIEGLGYTVTAVNTAPVEG